MRITNEQGFSEKYAIISYSHADSEKVKHELKMFDDNGICYWFDESMTAGTEGYDKQFCKMLDNQNCKGIIYFVSDAFLLSEPCAKEMEYFKKNYGIGNPEKFCLFILPAGYPYSDADMIYDKVDKYVVEKNDAEIRKMLRHLNSHIDLFLDLNQHGTVLYATLGNVNNYISTYCEKGQTFYNADIISGYEYSYDTFGTFPQIETKENDLKKIEFRDADKKPALYKPVEWLVFGNNILLSKKLLFAVDYLSLKYPLDKNNCNNNKTITEQIKDKFDKYFRQGDDKRKINKVRFLSEYELQTLLMGARGDIKKRREILLPDPTYFAQISNRKDVQAFWLAGDINDARRVDVATESLSCQEAGVELYYVRIVIEVEK
ncbi:hypothetical protein R84B8_03240 [Treponema sp. R8-4-B8]